MTRKVLRDATLRTERGGPAIYHLPDFL
ncbi:hypothetical protein MASSI9I_50431 [Massilia sp. 9I]|nr:hypothetical protein MASSI9I_50431 [Massilia sp. 9I]